MKNPGLLEVRWQSHLCIDTSRSEGRVNCVLIVRGENDNGLLLALAYSNVPVVFRKSRNRCMAIGEQLIEERLTDLREFFEFVQLYDGNDSGSSEMIVS